MEATNIKWHAVRTMAFTLAAFLVFGSFSFSQDLILNDGVSYSGSGTLNIKGNIDNTNTAGAVTLGGTVNLTGTASAQNVGNVGESGITFSTLNAQGSQPKQLNVAVTVASALAVSDGITVDVTDQTLNIGGTSTLNTSGVLDVSDVASTVNFTQVGGSQTVLGLTYAGTLGMSGTSTKSLGGVTSAATLTHADGALTVDNKLSVSGSGTFATVADITDTLSFGGSATVPSFGAITAITGGVLTSSSTNLITIGSLGGNTGEVLAVGSGGLTFTTATNGTGTIEAQAGPITIASLSGNSGTIRTTGAGDLSFTGAAANSGSITGLGGSGALTFGSTLAQTGGSVVAGTGNASFASTVTNDGTSSITAGTGAGLDFNGNVDNSGTITLTGTGSATMAGNFITSGTMSLAAGSNWTYDGASQDMAGGVSYGNLFTEGSGTKSALGTITVAGNFDNGGTGNAAIVTDMVTFNLNVTGSRDNTNGTLRFGGATNGLAFTDTTAAAGTVVYNGVFASGTVDSQQVAAGSYHNLQFANNAPKVVLTNTTVETGRDVLLAANVQLRIRQNGGDSTTMNIGGNGVGTLTLAAASSALLNEGALNIGGDLDLAGALTNNGAITVGF